MDFWALAFSLKDKATDLEPGFEMGNSRNPWKKLWDRQLGLQTLSRLATYNPSLARISVPRIL